LALLFLANLFNFFDRAIPAIVIEPIRLEFGLNDTQIGLLAAGFTVVYAFAGVPLGRLADRWSRKAVMGWGLTAWSVLTAATGAVGSYASLLLVRMGIGIGEASYAPAAQSLIADLYPATKRSRAMGIFMLGLPLGLILAYFTIGSITQALGSWRATFFIAAIPGLILAFFMFRIKEPARGATEEVALRHEKVHQPLRKILAIPTVWWLIFAILGYNFAAYIVNTFAVPLFQRYFGLELTSAAVMTGIVVGITGLIGLAFGGQLADKADRKATRYRPLLGAACLTAAVPLTFFALRLGPESAVLYVVIFAMGWLLGYVFYTAAYPAVADVVEPPLRATAIGLMFAVAYLFGGAGGPLVVGMLSDAFADQARIDAGAATVSAAQRAIGLHDAMLILVPISLAVAAVAMFLASRTVTADRAKMLAGMQASAA
jgi:MFS family permease